MLEGAALRAIAETMSVGATVRRHLLAHESVAPALYGLAVGLEDLSRVARDIKQCFEPDGTLADHASADLGPLRSRVRALQESIRSKLRRAAARQQTSGLFYKRTTSPSATTATCCRSRLRIKNEVRGIVHDASGSGQTVFIEPQAPGGSRQPPQDRGERAERRRASDPVGPHDSRRRARHRRSARDHACRGHMRLS